MYTEQLLTHNNYRTQIINIAQECQQFLCESKNNPLFKTLPTSYDDFHRVKVRHRKANDFMSEPLNEAFDEQYINLTQRAVFANGSASFLCPKDGQETFYIFPPDGYSFLYSKEVQQSSIDYKQVFDILYDQFGHEKGNELITDLLKFTYTESDLSIGLQSGAEIIMYNIPYFYAVRYSLIDSYSDLLTAISFSVHEN